MATGTVESAFGRKHVENNWEQQDWDNYQFRIKLMASMGFKAIREHRNFNADEKKFREELEIKNEELRAKYGVLA